MTHAVIYTRFSPRRNSEESESCDHQEQLCRDYAAKQGWTVKAAHRDEGVSGSVFPREGLTEALAAISEGDVLLVLKRDRLARDVRIELSIDHMVSRAGARTIAVHGDPTGGAVSPEAALVRTILAAVSEYERKLIAARTKVIMRQRQRAGQRMGRFAPYGFRLDPEDNARLLPAPEEQAAIARLRELVDQGQTYYQVTKALNEECPDAARGKAWNFRTVRRIANRTQ